MQSVNFTSRRCFSLSRVFDKCFTVFQAFTSSARGASATALMTFLSFLRVSRARVAKIHTQFCASLSAESARVFLDAEQDDLRSQLR